MGSCCRVMRMMSDGVQETVVRPGVMPSSECSILTELSRYKIRVYEPTLPLLGATWKTDQDPIQSSDFTNLIL